MTIVDIVSIALLLIFCVLGYRRGISGEFFRVAAVIFGLMGAFAYSKHFALLVSHIVKFLSFKVLHMFCGVVLFVIFAGAIILLGILFSRIIRLTVLGIIDRIGGIIIGAVKGLLIIGFVFWMTAFFPSLNKVADFKNAKIAGKSKETILIVYKLSKDFLMKKKNIL